MVDCLTLKDHFSVLRRTTPEHPQTRPGLRHGPGVRQRGSGVQGKIMPPDNFFKPGKLLGHTSMRPMRSHSASGTYSSRIVITR
jgi:hypothetical protein